MAFMFGRETIKPAHGQDLSPPRLWRCFPVTLYSDSNTLSLASNQQVKIQLVLRNPLDTKVAQVSGTAMASLFGGQVPPPIARRPVAVKIVSVSAHRALSIQVINGSKQSQAVFETPEEKQ